MKNETIGTEMKPSITEDQIRAYLEIHRTIADAIRQLGQVPAGVLYATVCAILTADQFATVLRTLAGAGLVREEESHLLVWTGPKA